MVLGVFLYMKLNIEVLYPKNTPIKNLEMKRVLMIRVPGTVD